MTATTCEDFTAQHDRDAALIASLRAQLAAANDSIARVRALADQHGGFGNDRLPIALVRAALSEAEPTR